MRTKRVPQKFSEECRREAVRLVRESDKPVKALGAELGVSETTLRQWLRASPRGNPTAAGRVLWLEEEVRRQARERTTARAA